MKKQIFILGIILFVSCTKPVPQLPANKYKEVDSTEIGMLFINKNLITQEDSLIEKLVINSKEKYTKTKSGIWYHIYNNTNRKKLNKLKTVHIKYISYSLDGEKIDAGEQKFHFTKKEIPVGLEEALNLMNQGESMKIIIPWYLAYGLKGNDKVPPYTSLIYEVKSIN